MLISLQLLSTLKAAYPIPNVDLHSTPLDPAKTGFSIAASASNDGQLGLGVNTAGDIDNDGYDDIIIGAWEENNSQGIVYVIYGGPSFSSNIDPSTTPLVPGTTGFTITGFANSQFGASVGTTGDVNKDGYDDIIIGAPSTNNNIGAAFVIYGGPRSSFMNIALGVTPLDSSTNGFWILGNSVGDTFGMSVGAIGDIDQDDYDDIIVGAFSKNTGQGAVYVIYGKPKGPSLNLDLSSTPLSQLTTGFSITQDNASAFLGRWVSLGDINGDGFDDIMTGAYGIVSITGAAYVIYGGPRASLPSINLSSTPLIAGSTGFTIKGSAQGDALGASVSTAGDINNDGYDDIIIGAYRNNNNRGAAYLIYGGPKASLLDIDLSYMTLDPATTGFKISGNVVGDLLGFPVSTAGDVNNDGFADMIIGAFGKNSLQGAAYVVYGGPKTSHQNLDLGSTPLDPATTGFSVAGNNIADQFGFCVSSAGDFNQDGFDDIIIGAPSKENLRGAAYVIYSTCVTPHCTSCASRTCQSCEQSYTLVNSVCEACPSKCNQCTDPSKCDQCTSPYLLYQSWCLPTCPNATYQDSGTCKKCPSFCSSCTSTNSCQTCDTGYVISNSLCVLPCASRTFNSSGTCIACPSFCTNCTSANSCQVCDQGYVLNNSLCVLPCPSRSFNSSGVCVDCPQGCSSCSSQISCQTCDPDYVISNSLCALPCSARKFNSGGVCVACPSFCKTCTSANSCQTCDPGYVLNNSLCVLPCSTRTFNSSGACVDCPSFCTACTSANSCQACDEGYVLNNSLCVLPCTPRTFNSSGTCVGCPQGCSSCTSLLSCQTCDSGYILSNSLCILPSKTSTSTPSDPNTEASATQTIASGMRAISSAVNIGSAASPLTALVSKIVQNTRYLGLSVTDELTSVYHTWETELISWELPNIITKFDYPKESPELFARYDIDSSFLANFWATFMTFALSVAIFVTFYVIQKLFENAKYEGWVSNLALKLVAGSFNFALVQAYGCFDDILFYLVLDFKTNPFNTFCCWVSFFSAVGFLALGCFLVFFNISKVRQYQRIKRNTIDVEAFNERNKKWELFYSDFNDDDLWSQSTLALLVVRSSLLSILTTTLYEYPLMQTAFFIIMDGTIILFLYFKNPFAMLRGKLAQYYFEAITLLVHLCTFILAFQDTFPHPSSWLRNVLSTGIIYLNTALIGGSLGFLFIETYKTISQKRKQARVKKSENTAIQDTSEVQSIISHSQSTHTMTPEIETQNRLNSVKDKKISSLENSHLSLLPSNNLNLSMNAEDESNLPQFTTNHYQQRRHNIFPLIRPQQRPQKIQQPKNTMLIQHFTRNPKRSGPKD